MDHPQVPTVTVLIAGSCNSHGDDSSNVTAIGTCTLIRDGSVNILVDTLGPWSREQLLSLLSDHGLQPIDIDFVIGTHGHPDHIGNLNLFTSCKAKHIVGYSIYQKDTYYNHDWSGGLSYELTPNVKVIPTPGHTLSCISVIVENAKNLGTVAVVGDLFECESDLKDESIWLSVGSEDPEKQRSNRSLILTKADYIIPGHGGMFKVQK